MSAPSSSHFLVSLQFSAIGLGVFPFTESTTPLWLIISILGGLVGIFTLAHNKLGNFGVYPEPVDGAQLITSGPYRWVRHPMYLSLLLFMFGIIMYNGNVLNYLALPFLLIAIIGKMNKEEIYLRSLFTDYADYSSRCKRVLPYIY